MPSTDYEQDTSTGFGPLRIKARGRAVMTNPTTNRGTAFTVEQRRELGIIGLVPTRVTNLENQVRRVYEQYQRTTTMLGRYLHLAGVRDRNEVLFYRLLTSNIEEMLPVIYTPTIGEAIERFSHEFSRPRGVFLSIDQPELMVDSFLNFGLNPDEVDLVVVTDSEGILGIGDQGIGGIQIAIGKLSVYTAAAGLHPRRCIPVILDVGTDNLGLLSSEMYLGERHARVRGPKYDEFLALFVTTVKELFPNAMLHWEDFGTANAHRLLTTYREEICTFNDDIQGTAAVVLAAILAGVDVTGLQLDDHRVCVFGAGSAGIGIANLIRDTMLRTGASETEEEAYDRFYAIGINGLYVDDQPELMGFQRPYARARADLAGWAVADPNHITLADVIRNARPTILIGTSTRGGAFTRPIVEEMASYCARPIIFPLSNPTSRAEATPADLLTWTDGRALVATGSPFGPVDHDGVRYTIAQANNALIFPGLGLGVATCQARRISDGMIAAASEALAGMVNAYRLGAPLLPTISALRTVSATVAVAVAQQAAAEGLANNPLTDPIQQIYERMWQPSYPEIEAIYRGPSPSLPSPNRVSPMTFVANEYQADAERYDGRMPYRRVGRSGLLLPAISLGMWHNFGDDVPLERQQAILRRAFDLGVTHFDLANNYGPPYGSAERNFGSLFARDFRPYRDELIISSKAGYDMWPGPYGQGGGGRKYVIASCDQSLKRMGLDYVDIFYSHRFDPDTPLEETMGALDHIVKSGRALYAGISSYSPAKTREAAGILADLGTPLLIHQPSYSMLNRWVEERPAGDGESLLDVLGGAGVGCIAFSPLAQGMLTNKYLKGIPEGSRAAQGKSLSTSLLTPEALTHIAALDRMAKRRGQSLAQLALAWVLRDDRVTSALIGASSVRQLQDSVGAVRNLDFTAAELKSIDKHAVDSGINLWAASSSD